MKIKPTPQLAFWLILITCILLFLIPSLFSLPGWEFFNLSNEESARIGDAIGGITAPFVAILAAILTFLAFWVQYDFNKKQHSFIEKERFEHNFYEMLQIHESITQSLKLDITDSSSRVELGNGLVIRKEGRDVFRLLYDTYPISANQGRAKGIVIPNVKQYIGLRDLFSSSSDYFEIYESNNAVGTLDHYFRHLYNIFKMINEHTGFDDKAKYEYARIVRSTLSQYELILLFYNCLSSHGDEKFKPLIEKYAVFNNIRKDLLAKPEDINKYVNTAYDLKIN